MKTKNNKLEFSKNSITELSDFQSIAVNGGCQWGDSSGATVDLTKTITTGGPKTDDLIQF